MLRQRIHLAHCDSFLVRRYHVRGKSYNAESKYIPILPLTTVYGKNMYWKKTTWIYLGDIRVFFAQKVITFVSQDESLLIRVIKNIPSHILC